MSDLKLVWFDSITPYVKGGKPFGLILLQIEGIKKQLRALCPSELVPIVDALKTNRISDLLPWTVFVPKDFWLELSHENNVNLAFLGHFTGKCEQLEPGLGFILLASREYMVRVNSKTLKIVWEIGEQTRVPEIFEKAFVDDLGNNLKEET